MFSIRQATRDDIPCMCAFDAVAQREARRVAFIEHSVASRACWVAVAEDRIAGYAVLEYSFYDNGFVSMLYVHPDGRRRGAGSALMRHLEAMCTTPKIFTSTNLSNLPMQRLLAQCGYVLTGVIDHLDEGDPEIVYFKRLSRREPREA